jgi:(E)-4-hydroxy-3-methylbut-2-enyl-diphosphate synthase
MRNTSLHIRVGNAVIGGRHIPIQTMIKNRVTDVDTTLGKIESLAAIGCDIIRITVPDMEAVQGLRRVLTHTVLPIVADIHFDYRLAILAVEAGVHKIRINPGNIGDENKVRKVIDCLKEHNVPVRIGINGGSLPRRLKTRYSDPVEAMIEAARQEIGYFEERGYRNIVLSFKSSSVMETISVNRLARQGFPYPFHIGVTEAGDMIDGTVKNAAGIAALLLDYIGNTIRVSLTAPEEDEVIVAKKILEAVGRREPSYEIISCPACGRTDGDIGRMVRSIKQNLAGKALSKQLKIAVMGCVVNGPGEAEHADFGVACGKGKSVLFKNGARLKVVHNDDILDEMMTLLEEYTVRHDPAGS